MLDGRNKTINEQLEILENILRKHKNLITILERLENYSKENESFKNYYLAAGSVNQTVLNYLHGYEIDNDIEDFDIVYYDEDTSYEAEDIIIKDIERLLKDLDKEYDVKNEKRVPIWYNEKYNTNRKEYKSVEDAISKWGTTITCIGVRLENNKLKVVAPYGLNDLFNMIIRPVKLEFEKSNYIKKCNKWKKKWPNLSIIDWEE